MKRVLLLAHPAGHSLSPAMHNAAFKHSGLEAVYEAHDVPPAALGEAVSSLREKNILGANVTVPHKQAVVPLLDALSDAAAAIGAVNTVVKNSVRDGGRLVGHNTDAAGFLWALQEADFEPRGKRVVVLGAGGAARAVVYALLTAGVAELGVYNRTPERARALADAFAHLGVVEVLEPSNLDTRVRGADGLINTTSVGMARGGHDPDTSPLPGTGLPYRGFVCDIVYRPSKTRLLRDAEAAGLRTQNGLPMLIHQGAEAFRLWTGRDAPAEVMRRAALNALAG